MTDQQKAEIRKLLNDLNLGTAKVALGDLLIDHIDALKARIADLEAAP